MDEAVISWDGRNYIYPFVCLALRWVEPKLLVALLLQIRVSKVEP